MKTILKSDFKLFLLHMISEHTLAQTVSCQGKLISFVTFMIIIIFTIQLETQSGISFF
jgi:hypothetical protein